MQIISNKTDSEIVYLIKYMLYLALQTDKNYSSSGNLQNIFNINYIYQSQPRSHEVGFPTEKLIKIVEKYL